MKYQKVLGNSDELKSGKYLYCASSSSEKKNLFFFFKIFHSASARSPYTKEVYITMDEIFYYHPGRDK